MTDQQRADMIGYAGGPVRTPNLDALARQGVIFENAYSGSTVCVPARACLITGLHHHRVQRQGRLNLALKEGFWTVARALRAAGYQTALIGKMHFEPIRADHGFDHQRSCEHLSAGYAVGQLDDYHEWLTARGKPDLRMQEGPDGLWMPTKFSGQAFPEDRFFHPTDWVTREAIEYLERRDPSRPYFMILSYPHPHAPYDPPEPFASAYAETTFDLPPGGDAVNRGLPPAFMDVIFRSSETARYPKSSVAELPSEHVQRILALMCGLIAHIDDAVGHVIARVDLSKTLVCFTSDHGDYGGRRGLMGKVPWLPFDDLAKVPFFAAGYGVVGHRTVPEPVQSCDFALTCLDAAGVEVPAPVFDTKSLMPVLQGAKADPDRTVFCCASMGWPMVRRGRYKYIAHAPTAESVLYDLSSDPDEVENLAPLRTHATIRAELERIAYTHVLEPPVDLLGP